MPRDNWDGWALASAPVIKSTGVYYFLNLRTGSRASAVTVKARDAGSFLCLQPECREDMRVPHTFDEPPDTRRGCTHTRFIAHYVRGHGWPTDEERAASAAPLVEDFPADALDPEE